MLSSRESGARISRWEAVQANGSTASFRMRGPAQASLSFSFHLRVQERGTHWLFRNVVFKVAPAVGKQTVLTYVVSSTHVAFLGAGNPIVLKVRASNVQKNTSIDHERDLVIGEGTFDGKLMEHVMDVPSVSDPPVSRAFTLPNWHLRLVSHRVS
jgi:hypothetical protein